MLHHRYTPNQIESNIDNSLEKNVIPQKPYVFNNTSKFKESITFEMIESQMNLIKSIINEEGKMELLIKNKLNLDTIDVLKSIILNAKYKLIEYLGNINPSTKKSDINKLKQIKIDCLSINDQKFITITSALIDILLESTNN